MDAPVRPDEIVNAQSMRLVPLFVGILVAAAAVVGLVAAVAVSVVARRHELGILRVLGFTGRQLRRTVLVQSVATVLASLVIGIPVGLILGRQAWRRFADQLGVVTTPATPLASFVAIVAGSIIVAGLAAVVPAHKVGRQRAAEVLRRD